MVRIKNNVILSCGPVAIESEKDDKVERIGNIIYSLDYRPRNIKNRIKMWLLKVLLKEEIRFAKSFLTIEDAGLARCLISIKGDK